MSDEGAITRQDPTQEFYLRLGPQTVWLSADKIRYEGGWHKAQYPLNAVTRIGWGIASLSTITTFLVIPVFERVTVTYHLRFGDDKHLTDMSQQIMDTPEARAAFTRFTDRLWRAVGARLLADVLRGLREGKHYPFGDLVVDDRGVELRKPRAFRAAERIHLTWDQVQIWQSNGRFCVGAKDDKKVYAALPYAEANNAHVLETVIRAAFKEGLPRLSAIAYTDQRQAAEKRMTDLDATIGAEAAQFKALESQIGGMQEQAKNGVSVDPQEFDRLVVERNRLLERLKNDNNTLGQLMAEYKAAFE